MPKNRPARRSPVVYVEIEANYRWRGSVPECCFLSVVEQRGELHRRIAHTEHIHGSPERLIDQVLRRTRELTLEYVLVESEPF